MNYTFVIKILIFSFILCQCSLNETQEHSIVSADLDIIVTVEAGDVIYFQELDITVDVQEFSNYVYNGILPPNCTMKANFVSDVDHFEFTLQHFQAVEGGGRQFYFDLKPEDKHYVEEVFLTEEYKLVFRKFYWLDPFAKEGEISQADLVLTRR